MFPRFRSVPRRPVSMPRRHSLSVIIITLDEADRVRPCLESVAPLADEIVVVDAGSTDGTIEICREYTGDVHVTHDWPGDGIQKQRALDRATGDWVLRVDADERVSPELRAEIESLLERDALEETAFSVPWATYVFGRYLTRGECGVRHLNLFRREGARFEPWVVHAALVPAPGPTGTLHGRLLHDAARDFRHLLGKLADYAYEAGTARAARGRRSTIAGALLRSWGRFLKVYVWRLGFLDGWRGLLMAALYAHYVFNKHAATWAEGHPSQPPAVVRGRADRDQEEVRIRPPAKGEPGSGDSAPETASIE